MSTRAAIARSHGDGFLGVYHHWDGYPTALGKTLWELYQGYFWGRIGGDLGLMLAVLIDEHPAGWSTINGADFTLAAGFTEDMAAKQPQCFCHGDRHEPAQAVTEQDDLGMEWAYVFDEAANSMAVLERVRPDSGHAVGMFGTLGTSRKSGEREDAWAVRWTGPLDGEEPDWAALEAGRPEAVKEELA